MLVHSNSVVCCQQANQHRAALLGVRKRSLELAPNRFSPPTDISCMFGVS